MAPEFLMNSQYSYSADMYSLGVILYRMIFGIYPFQGN